MSVQIESSKGRRDRADLSFFSFSSFTSEPATSVLSGYEPSTRRTTARSARYIHQLSTSDRRNERAH